jgi:hypothetical protein
MDAVREPIHPPRDPRGYYPTMPDFPTCSKSPGPTCRICPRWKCPGCMTLRPWCFGAADGFPALCDDCWDAAVNLREARP